jgi:dethiobiotin synthetase
VAPYRYGPAVSPHLAAELCRRPVDPAALVARASALAAAADALLVEGVGGLLVPLTPGFLVRDLAVDLGLPVVVAARPGLGTINHTLLTVESARRAGLDVRGVAMTPWPAEPEALEESNRRTVARLTGLEVTALPRVRPGELATLAGSLPLDHWL